MTLERKIDVCLAFRLTVEQTSLCHEVLLRWGEMVKWLCVSFRVRTCHMYFFASEFIGHKDHNLRGFSELLWTAFSTPV